MEIPMYLPQHLTEAAKRIREEVERFRGAREEQRNAEPVLDDAFRDMMKRLAAIPKHETAGLRYCFSEKELYLMAEYFFGEAAEEEGTVLSAVLTEELDEQMSILLYEQILRHYRAPKLQGLFQILRSKKVFDEAILKKYGWRTGGLVDALLAGTAPEYINREAALRVNGEIATFRDALQLLGVQPGTPLEEACLQLYILVCDAAEYRKLGADAVMQAAENFDLEKRRLLLRNMITVLDSFQLEAFIPCLPLFIELAAEPGSSKYMECLGGLPKEVTQKYDLWSNQYKIRELLGDGERAEFWYHYAGTAKMAAMTEQRTLLLLFDRFVVIEPAEDNAAYFYDMEYYTKIIRDELARKTSCKELCDWLYHNTEWAADGSHPKHWRKVHVGNWQMDMKDYMRDQRLG